MRAESTEPGQVGFLIIVEVGDEVISRVQDPDWLTFVLGCLGKKGIGVCWAQPPVYLI